VCLYIKTYNKQKYREYKVYPRFLRTGTVEILIYIYIYIYIYRHVSSLESYMSSRVLNTVVELIRLEDKLELLHMNFI
jgi:hypothetical protein